MADLRWRRLGAVLFAILIQVVNGYEETFSISQISPKSARESDPPQYIRLQTSSSLAFNIEPSAQFIEEISDNNDDVTLEDIVNDEIDLHHIIARSADPMGDRESRSINIDEIPVSNNNEIDNELELHNKRKYYEIHPTKTRSFMRNREDYIQPSADRFGDRIDFRFPGEELRVPKARALHLTGPKIRPSAVQPIFATATPNGQGRQNQAEIQNIITGIVKLLNGNVNVQANSQLLRPGRPMNSRINNRGPPRIAEAPLPPEFDKPVTQYVPTKTPPPYPFDRPPHHPINLPEQIIPPVSSTPYRPGLHRPNLPPWHRPRPRPPPNRRPNPNHSNYKPPRMPVDIPTVDLSEEKPDEDEDVLTLNDSEGLENNIHLEDKDPVPTTTEHDVEEEVEQDKVTTIVVPKENATTTSTTSTTTTTTTTTTEKPQTTTEEVKTTTEKPSTTTSTEKPKEKPLKPDKEKKKDSVVEKDKKHKTEDKQASKTKNETSTEASVIEPSEKPTTTSIAAPTPTEGLPTHAPAVNGLANVSNSVQASSINSQPLPPSQGIPYQPYRPRPGIVLDDPDFKPKGQRAPYRDAPVVTASETRLPGGYGEIFDVTVSAIQGPGGGSGASVQIQNVSPLSGDDIIVSASGSQGFVSIDGKRTYLNLFGETSSIAPTPVVRPPQSVATPPPSPIGTGIAIPADDIPTPPARRPPSAPPRPPPAPPRQPPAPSRRPQPTVRIDTCIVGDDSTCDQAQNEKCRTEGGISSCQCRPGYARRVHRDPCRRVVSLLLNLRVDKLYDRKVVWDGKLADRDSDAYQTMGYEAVRAIDSAFSMTPFSDDFVGASVNSLFRGEQNNQGGVFVNYTILMQESPETVRSAVATDIQRHLLGVIRRRSNNIGASALWVETPAGSVMPPSDLDECASAELNDCNKVASCTNTWGGFRCTCPSTTLDPLAGDATHAGRRCQGCPNSHCNDRGQCRYENNHPYCSCSSGYYGSTCEVDGEVVGVAVGASLAAALVIGLTLAALMSWSRKWSREQKAAGMGSPVFSYMAANTIKAPPVGQPPYQVTLEERMRWAQIAEAMAANHYAQAESAQQMATRPSSAMFGGYPTLPPVPMPRTGLYGHHTGTLNTIASRANTSASHHMYGYTNHATTESTSSEASSHQQELLVPRPKSRARSMHNQNGIYYDVEYENAPEAIYGTKGIPLSTYTVSRGPPFYRS